MAKRTLPMFLAVFILMILVPIHANAAGNENPEYAITLTSDIEEKLTPGEKSLAVGETFSVKVMISGNGVSTYNAYDLKLSYDAENLVFLSDASETADPDRVNITDDNGHIRIKGYGDDKSISVPAVTLVFETKAKGSADVKLISGLIDTSEKAGARDADKVTKIQDTAETLIEGYKVTTEGDSVQSVDCNVAFDGDDITFEVKEQKGCAYVVTVTVGGVDISEQVVSDNQNGYTIPGDAIAAIGGKVVISAEPVPMSFTVEIDNGDVVGDEIAKYNTDYIFTLNREKGYRYTIEVTIGGDPFTEFDVEEDVYTIPGEAITGDIKISVNKKDNTPMAAVTFAGAGAKDGSGEKETRFMVEYPFKIKQKKGYTYSVTVYVDGRRTSYDYDYELDTYYILDENVTGNIVIVIGKIATIEILEYITLEKQNMYLVVFNGHVNEGDVPKYDGRSMYWSDRYNAYAWLVTSSDTVKKVKSAAEKNITLNLGKPAANIDYSGDADRNLRVDTEDTKLTWEMYEGKHSLDFMEMQKLLSADVYTDKKLNIRDVRAIANSIS